MNSRTARHLVASLLTLSLFACSSATDAQQKPLEAQGPSLTLDQVSKVIDQVEESLQDPVQATQDADSPITRIAGTYAAVLRADLSVAAAAKAQAPAYEPVEELRIIVPRSAQWPRSFVIVGNAQRSDTPLIQLYLSRSADQPYALAQEVSMLPGASLPAFSAATKGTPVLAPEETVGTYTPADLLVRYADFLNKGQKSASADVFTDDAFTTAAAKARASLAKELASVAKVSFSHVAVDAQDAVYSYRATDGSVVMMGTIKQTTSIQTKKDAGTVAVSDPRTVALLGSGSITSAAQFVTLIPVVMVLPSVEGAQVSVIAAESSLVAAESAQTPKPSPSAQG